MTGRQRRLGRLLCTALLGLVVAAGLLVEVLLGPAVATAYALVALVVVAAAIARGRRLLVPPAQPPGRTCTCCTATSLDPVRLV